MTKKLMFSLMLLLVLAGFQKVDLNIANYEQIALLPSIGQKLAKNMVTLRLKKKLLSLEDLESLPGMTAKKLDTIRPYIFFGHKNEVLAINVSPKKNTLKSLPRKPMIELRLLEQEVVKALDLEPVREHELLYRARRSALAPKLSVTFDLDRQTDSQERRILHNQPNLITRGGLDFGMGIRAVFDLPKLIFNKDELEINKFSLKRLEKREHVLQEVHKLYFRYERLARSGEAPSDESTLSALAQNLSELAASLDSMSNGAFSRFQEAQP